MSLKELPARKINRLNLDPNDFLLVSIILTYNQEEVSKLVKFKKNKLVTNRVFHFIFNVYNSNDQVASFINNEHFDDVISIFAELFLEPEYRIILDVSMLSGPNSNAPIDQNNEYLQKYLQMGIVNYSQKAGYSLDLVFRNFFAYELRLASINQYRLHDIEPDFLRRILSFERNHEVVLDNEFVIFLNRYLKDFAQYIILIGYKDLDSAIKLLIRAAPDITET